MSYEPTNDDFEYTSVHDVHAVISDLRAQIAERDAQLAAVTAELKVLGEAGQHLCEGLEKIANRQFCQTIPDPLYAPVAVAQATLTRANFIATRQPKQDKE
jgi:hypothetical protein